MVEVAITATIAATTGRRASVVTLKRPVDGESLSRVGLICTCGMLYC